MCVCKKPVGQDTCPPGSRCRPHKTFFLFLWPERQAQADAPPAGLRMRQTRHGSTFFFILFFFFFCGCGQASKQGEQKVLVFFCLSPPSPSLIKEQNNVFYYRKRVTYKNSRTKFPLIKLSFHQKFLTLKKKPHTKLKKKKQEKENLEMSI